MGTIIIICYGNIWEQSFYYRVQLVLWSSLQNHTGPLWTLTFLSWDGRLYRYSILNRLQQMKVLPPLINSSENKTSSWLIFFYISLFQNASQDFITAWHFEWNSSIFSISSYHLVNKANSVLFEQALCECTALKSFNTHKKREKRVQSEQ